MSEPHSFRHEPRSRLTNQQRAEAFLEAGGKCYLCGRKLRSGDKYHLDHKVALENGGKDEVSNLAPCCVFCHRGKTANDHSQAAKGRAVAVRHYVPSSERKSKGKPLMGTKRSGFKKKMDGEWERRK